MPTPIPGAKLLFLARDVALDRVVAIKLLPPALARNAELRDRFLREARTGAGLAHPHIVPIHAVEACDDLVFFVMGFVEGETLGARIRRAGPLPAAELVRIVEEVAWALGHAHARGIVHRDVKPDNVLLERETGRALVTDFGIARTVETSDAPVSGGVRGTPQYMSPEQALGETVDARSDLYSLGVTAFFAATGRLPFESQTVAGFLAKHAGETPPPVSTFAPQVPSRFASAEDLVEELGAARGALVQLPAPLRRCTDEARAAGIEIATYAGATVSLVVVFEIIKALEGDFFGMNSMTSAIELLGVTALGGLLVSRLVQLGGQARALRAAGYDHTAVVWALKVEARDRSPEGEGTHPRREAWLTGTAGALATALGVLLLRMDSAGVHVFGFALSVAAPALTLRQLWVRIGASRLWGRLLRGRFGRILFRFAGIGLRDVPALPAAGEHTEVALGRAADALFHDLPADTRARVGDVPALVARLEADARDLRAHPGDPAATQRLASTVAVLETLRLDLLRFAAGTGTIGELTENVAAARQVGEEIDAVLAAREQLEALEAGESIAARPAARQALNSV